MSTIKDASLEKSLEKLETLVRELESGELSLDDGLKFFEKGVLLYKDCKKQLDKAEKKISKLSQSLKEEELS